MNLINKIIVITGGSSGLGKEMAKILAANGNKVVICAQNKKEIEKSAKEIKAIPFVANVTKKKDIENLAKFTIKSFGRIDVWINNAGIWMAHSPFEKTNLKRVRELFEVNVFGAMYGSQLALLQMKKQKQGILVNIISISALTGRPNSSGYAASKWAIRGFTNSIQKEYKGTKIKIIGVYPDKIKTSLYDEKKPGDINKYMLPDFVAKKIIENLKKEKPSEELIIK
ncbi:SDR family oxidoreductase [Candidatus Wolfebacteria bacterium]|nr:SDR family oxidoreductase [Candidatus Wolfebacteria bacterium]